MKAALKYLLAFALFGSAYPLDVAAQSPVFAQRFGHVEASCQRVPKSRELVCVVVYRKQPYLGIQLGSKGDPESVAITAGARREPGTDIVIRVDNHAVHSTAREGFVDYEAESMLTEIEHGERITVRFQSSDSNVKTADTFPLADLKAALEAVRDFRKRDGQDDKGI